MLLDYAGFHTTTIYIENSKIDKLSFKARGKHCAEEAPTTTIYIDIVIIDIVPINESKLYSVNQSNY